MFARANSITKYKSITFHRIPINTGNVEIAAKWVEFIKIFRPNYESPKKHHSVRVLNIFILTISRENQSYDYLESPVRGK